ncbi:MAG: cupin domain-containing protein [Alphaproteobacteria bacterium]|nr:cupin domain-containing protein [Alphaproteobacteria bacterium]
MCEADASTSARPTVFVDNDRVRVTEWRFAPGAATGWHRHEFDYVVVPVTDGTLLLRTPDGEKQASLAMGQPYFRKAGVEHDVINGGEAELAFVEIEMK